MTQFSLAIMKGSCEGLIPIERHQDDFLLDIAKKIFPGYPVSEIFVLDLKGKTIDQLMLEAQRLVGFLQFENTELYRELSNILPAVDELVFWYGSDCDDLDFVCDVSDLMSALKCAVSESVCEVYIHYRRMRLDG